MEFFDETKLNDDFTSEFEKCIPFDGIDIHLIATVVYKLLQTFITHVQKKSMFSGLTSFIEQIESKEWLEQNDIELKQLQLELRKLANVLKEMEYPEFRTLYYNIVDVLPFTDKDTTGYKYNIEIIVHLTYNLMKNDIKVSEQDFIDSLIKTYNRNKPSLGNLFADDVDSVADVDVDVADVNVADTL